MMQLNEITRENGNGEMQRTKELSHLEEAKQAGEDVPPNRNIIKKTHKARRKQERLVSKSQRKEW